MPGIEYIELFDKIVQKGMAFVELRCCGSSSTNFKLLRVQMRGDILYSDEGVWLADESHDRKCRILLELSKRKYYDLVLFPEYCISYRLLDAVVSDRNLWPDDGKLWCLPCQGIPKHEFDNYIEALKEKDTVCLIEDAISDGVSPNPFVNAVFYCLRVKKDGKPYLCLAPQLKTHHMSDHDCVCEAVGLTTGSRVFKLGGRLITFLCADTLNNNIYWQDLQNNAQTNGIIILHPQMNRSPKHKDFRRVRDEMWSHNHQGLCITCNWAEGTRLIDSQTGTAVGQIDFSWSCVYQKHTNFPFEKWKTDTEGARKESAACDLFAAFMKMQKTEVWFSTSAEQATAMILPNPATDQYAVTGIRSLKATDRFCWQGTGWEPTPYSSTLESRMKTDEAKEELGKSAGIQAELEPCYHFPFTEQDKYLVDRFFSVTLPNAKKALLTIDEDEDLADWAVLLDKPDFSAAREAFHDLYTLTRKALKGDTIPRRLYGLKGEHEFICEGDESSRSCFNVDSATGKMLIVFAKDDVAAGRLSKSLLKEVFDNNTNLAESKLGVVYPDFTGDGFHFLPESTADISHGEHLIQEGDLTNGGD